MEIADLINIGVELEFDYEYIPSDSDGLHILNKLLIDNGCELNQVGNYNHRHNKGQEWLLTLDGWGQYPTQFEISTPIMNVDNLHLLTKLVKILKKTGATINRYSGMHVHLSTNTTTQAKLDINSIRTKIDKLYKKLAWNERLPFLVSTTHDRMQTVADRNVFINHIEIRVFNGTLNYQTVLRRIIACVEFYNQDLTILTKKAA